MLEDLVPILVPLGICVVLPVLIVWLCVRAKQNETNRRTEIILAALEKNPDADNIEDFLKKISPKGKTIKERLLRKLLTGILCTLLGLGAVILGICLDVNNIGHSDDPYVAGGVGAVFIAVGIAFLISYFVGKKMLAEEMKAELDSMRKE